MKKRNVVGVLICIFFLCILIKSTDAIQASDTYTLGQNSTYDGQSTMIVTTDKDTTSYENDYKYNKPYEKVTKIIFQEGITRVYNNFMGHFPNVKEIVIPASMTYFNGTEMNTELDTYTIDKKNSVFDAVDGVLYATARDRKQIAWYPIEKTDAEYVVPEKVSLLTTNMEPNENVTKITIGDNEVDEDYFTIFIKNAFPNLKSISVTAANKKYSSKDGVVFSKDETKLITYPPKGKKDYTIPDGTKVIQGYAFNDTDIEEITMSRDTKTIKSYAFYQTGLKKVTFPDNGVSSIKSMAFSETKLTDVTLPEGLTYIGDLAFSNTPLENVKLPSTLKNLAYGAFEETKLTKVNLPKGLTTLSTEAFSKTKLTQITMDAANKNLCMYRGGIYNKSKTQLIWWPNCYKASKLVFPSSLKTLDYSAIENEDASTIVIPKNLSTLSNAQYNNVKKIMVAAGNKTFKVKQNILYKKDMSAIVLFPNGSTEKKVTFPEGLKTIDLDMFVIHNNVEKLTLPKSLQKIISSYAYTIPGGGFEKLTTIQLRSGNRFFKVKDGILYDKAMTKLCWFPINKKIQNYVMPSTVREVKNVSLGAQNYLENITISANCTSVMPDNYDDGEAEDKFSIGLECPKLKAVNFKSTKAGYCSAGGVVFSKNWSALEFYPVGRTKVEYTIPEGCRYMKTKMDNSYLKKLNLSSDMYLDDMEYIEENIRGLSSLEEITVPSTNPDIQSVDGVVYSKGNKVSMLLYPIARKSSSLRLPIDFQSNDISKLAKESDYLKTIEVTKGNPYCYVKENCLYGMNGTLLYKMP